MDDYCVINFEMENGLMIGSNLGLYVGCYGELRDGRILGPIVLRDERHLDTFPWMFWALNGDHFTWTSSGNFLGKHRSSSSNDIVRVLTPEEATAAKQDCFEDDVVLPDDDTMRRTGNRTAASMRNMLTGAIPPRFRIAPDLIAVALDEAERQFSKTTATEQDLRSIQIKEIYELIEREIAKATEESPAGIDPQIQPESKAEVQSAFDACLMSTIARIKEKPEFREPAKQWLNDRSMAKVVDIKSTDDLKKFNQFLDDVESRFGRVTIPKSAAPDIEVPAKFYGIDAIEPTLLAFLRKLGGERPLRGVFWQSNTNLEVTYGRPGKPLHVINITLDGGTFPMPGWPS